MTREELHDALAAASSHLYAAQWTLSTLPREILPTTYGEEDMHPQEIATALGVFRHVLRLQSVPMQRSPWLPPDLPPGSSG